MKDGQGIEMHSLSKFFRILCLMMILALSFSPVQAADAPKTSAKTVPPMHAANGKAAEDPDPADNPLLTNIVKSGAKIFYMGNRSGLDGWFITKDGQMQIAYTTADKQSMLIGAMFDGGGENVTMQQIENLTLNNKGAAGIFGNIAREQTDIASAGAAPAASATPVSNVGGLPSVSLSPGEKLLQDFSAAHGVVLGNNITAPEIFMVMDPNCPHCQATWRALRDTVLANRLRVDLIPIAAPGTDNERAAAILLKLQDPLDAWDKYVLGDQKQLAGTPDAALITEVQANHAITDSWGIAMTPYLAYRGKDGKIKVLQGEPAKISSVLADLL